MITQLNGIIRGKQIELERETGLPAGAEVVVTIERRPLTLEDKRRLLRRLSGSWANDPSLKAIFEEIQRERAQSQPRDVDFNVAS